MSNRAAKFASAMVGGILAGASFTAPQHGASAAECLTEAGPSAQQGQHWYYRIERGTKRHCWYLRDQAGKVSNATASDDSSPASDTAAQDSEPMQRSLEDARAELPAPRPRAQNTAATPVQAAPAIAPSVTPPASSPFPDPPQATSQASAQGSAVSSRWPAPSDVASTTAAPQAAADANDAEPDSQPAPEAAVTPAPPAVPASSSPVKASASLQMLFVVILGALALAGLTASIVYRLGRRRKIVRMDARERRAAIRESFDNAPKSPWTPPWVEPVIETTPPRSSSARSAARTTSPQERYQKIEEILAQLVKQAQQSDA